MGGDGPTYLLTISGDGTVQYEGRAGVFVRGKRTGHISNSAVKQLVEEFRKAHFFELQDSYSSHATDLPGRVVTLQAGPISKHVVDLGFHDSGADSPDGFLSGAPQSLIELENRIEVLANVRRWVKGHWFQRLFHWH